MPKEGKKKKYEVTVTRTKQEVAVFSISAEDEPSAEKKIQEILEPAYFGKDDEKETTKRIKKASSFFADHLSEDDDPIIEFEYIVQEIDE